MSLTPNSSPESARRKFFVNSTYIMSRKWESKVFQAEEAKMSLTAINSPESTRTKICVNSTYIVSLR